MKIQKQDDVYEESDSFEDGDTNTDEGNENTSTGIQSFWGIPKKVFYIIVAIAVIAILGIIVFCTQRDKLASGSSGGGVGAVYDESGNYLGTADDMLDGMPILDDNSMLIGTINSAGSMTFYDKNGELLGNYDPVSYEDDYSDNMSTDDYSDSTSTDDYSSDYVDETTTESAESDIEDPFAASVTDPSVTYSGDDIMAAIESPDAVKLLRKYGYTGDEIELATELNLSVEKLVEAAKAVRNKAAVEALERMSDHASKEYQMMYKYSIFSSPKLKYEKAPYTGDNVYQLREFKTNADFEKVPTYGNQLMLKLKLANNFYAFMFVTPERYGDLPDTGNMVVQVNGVIYGKTQKSANFYITDITEVGDGSGTVNDNDDASSIQELLDIGVIPEDDVTEETEGDDFDVYGDNY